MIRIKTFLLGFFWINLLASPFYGLLMYFLLALGGSVGLAVSWVLCLMAGQLVLLLLMIVVAKALDALLCNASFFSPVISQRSFFTSTLLSGLIAAAYFNIFIDNLFQVKLGHYEVVVLPLLAAYAYYFICWGFGKGFRWPKWLT